MRANEQDTSPRGSNTRDEVHKLGELVYEDDKMHKLKELEWMVNKEGHEPQELGQRV
jgi:hypothetical protein